MDVKNRDGVFHTIDGQPIVWRDIAGTVHRCEGANVHPGIRLLWTDCERDVPANAAFLADGNDRVTCPKCLAATASTPVAEAPPANRHPLCDRGQALAARIRGLHPDIGSAFTDLFAALAPLETMANELASEAWEDELRRTEAIKAGDSVVAMIDTAIKPMRVPGGAKQ
jgi:hypothetical protein